MAKGTRYTQEFRREAVQLLLQGRTYASVSEALGCSTYALREWTRKYKIESGEISDEPTVAERAEIRDLKRVHMPTTDIKIRSLTQDDAPACDEIIRSLPYHFGDAEGREACAKAIRSHSGFCATADGRLLGFVTWKPWFDAAVEITWMAVHADQRGRGIGTKLVKELVSHGGASNLRFLLVTTLSPSIPEPGVSDGYERTRSFYTRCGFVPTWEPEGWWNERNQALLMVRPLE